MYTATNYTIGSHDHRIVYSFGDKECTKANEEAGYCFSLVGITHHRATLYPYLLCQTACLIKKTLIMYLVTAWWAWGHLEIRKHTCILCEIQAVS